MMNQKFLDNYKQGTLALQQGAYSNAIKFLEKALEYQPDDLNTTLNLSSALILLKRFKKAVPLLESLTDDYQDNPMLWLNLGAAYLGNPILATAENQHKAISAFQMVLKINPKTRHAAYNIALVYRDQKNYREALQWFEQEAAGFPDDEDAQFYIEKMKEKLTEPGE
jgi:tetratricopeptide (TPR) repeat protein